MMKKILSATIAGFLATTSHAQESDAALAQQLSNPIASLISVPFQLNYDEGFGANGNGDRVTLNIQPVIPISLNENWNVISRTIVPLVWQDDVIPGTSQEGVGDIVQSLFFSPKLPTRNGVIWGAGPVFLIPTGTNGISADEFGIGPTLVALKQSGGWTYGALANHIWAVDSGAPDISNTFLQPFLSYTTPDAWTYTVNSETTYDWKAEEASVPINLQLSKLVKFGSQPVSIAGGLRYYADSTTNGPDDWGLRFAVTFLFPR